jgi:hypothetical protein
MKKLIFIFILTVMGVNIAHAKGGGHASGHATVASHMMVHGSSHQPDKLTGRKMTKNESITVFVTFFTFLIIAGASMAWSDE